MALRLARNAMNKPTIKRAVDPVWCGPSRACVRILAGLACLVLTCLEPVQAAPALDAPVECTLQSTRLSFGTLTQQRPTQVQGEGEVIVACQNLSPTVRTVDITVGFSSMGAHTAMLQSSQDALAVDFFLDVQCAERWGDGNNGGRTLQASVRLAPGEHRQLRLPVHALLQNRRDAKAGLYLVHVPVQITAVPR